MRTISFLFVVAIATTAHAVPFLLQEQGRLLDSADQPLTGSQSVVFSLYDNDTMGNQIWTETLDVSFTDGYFSVTLGQTNPIDEGVLASPGVWLGLTVASEDLLPRQLVVSVPYAVMAGTAENVVGGIVDVTSISVEGMPVVDGAGNWVGPPPADTLSGLTCNAGDVAQKTSSGWTCVPGTSFDTTLTESQVEAYITNSAIDLANGTTMAGEGLSTGPHNLYDGNDFALSNQACTIGAAITAIDSDGALSCAPLGTFTVWGQTACPVGDPLYTGFPALVHSYGFHGSGTPFCMSSAADSLTSWNNWGTTYLLFRHSYPNGSHYQQFNNVDSVPCAVCRGEAFTHWGSHECPTGTTEVYDGFIGGIRGQWNTSQSAGPICLRGDAGSNWSANAEYGMVTQLGGNPSRYSTGEVFCAVCR